MNSTERHVQAVQAWYAIFLKRGADDGGLWANVHALDAGARDEDLMANILASDEYFARP